MPAATTTTGDRSATIHTVCLWTYDHSPSTTTGDLTAATVRTCDRTTYTDANRLGTHSVQIRFRGCGNVIVDDSDYQALRLLLHSNDATEELMIVDSLKPVVQMFSYLEQHCQNCSQIQELVSRMKNDRAMQTLLRTTVTLPADVHDVNSRIYALQDVFQEIAPSVTTTTPPTVTSNPEAVLSA